MSQLTKHIEAENAKAQAWADEAPGRYAGMVVTDESHWEGYGVTTVDQYEHYMLGETIINVYKDVHGMKPRWVNFDDMTMLEMEDMLNGLRDDAAEQQKERDDALEEGIVKFEESVSDLIESGAGDRETAIRWLREADKQGQFDDAYFEYVNDIPAGYLRSQMVVVAATSVVDS